jgi:tetratricopeptide (TPR) repeat protein
MVVAQVARQAGDLAHAERLCRRSAAARPLDGLARLRLAEVLSARGRAQEAAQELSAATRLAGDRPDVLEGAARLLVETGHGSQAAPIVQRLLEIDPANRGAHRLLERLDRVRGGDPLTEDQFARIRELRKRTAERQDQLGVLYFVQRRFDLAARHFEEVVRLRPRHAVARVKLAEALLRLERRPEAIGHLRAARDLIRAGDPLEPRIARSMNRSGRL